ncbi:hypothetical protein FB45DRAFT_885778 [Roridomyces roridus]|uniref:Uncharacterized protein n=1 Tax=Roridomyces roridus TaxID=1738132 RepID=A0AAD7CI13_9AGAR|nr:hypothetical protein FB45DRAFT_885778 [Roridomyces roridus]
MTTSASQWRRLTRTAKSMDNLRGSAMNHPTTLQPGGGRGRVVPPLPNSRGGIRDILLAAGLSASIMGPTPRSVRPLPIKGSSHSSTVVPEFSPVTQNSYGTRIPGSHPSATLMSPSNDPYPRPQSAFGGDTLMSPNSQYQRSMQTSGFGSSLDSDYGRLPRAPSPTHPWPTHP